MSEWIFTSYDEFYMREINSETASFTVEPKDTIGAADETSGVCER